MVAENGSKNSVSTESEVTICSCTELSLTGFKEVGFDEEKMKIFEEKHAAKLQKCEALGDRINKEMNALSDEENEILRKRYMDNCPAMKELEALIMEQYEQNSSDYIEDVIEEVEPETVEED